MTPELIAAAAIEAAAEREIGQPRGALSGVGKIAVEAISAVELVIVPAGRMAELLELERAARVADPVRGALAHLGGEVARTIAYLRHWDELASELLPPTARAVIAPRREERIAALICARDGAAAALAEESAHHG